MTIAMVSGGFDPLHVGHLSLFEGAKKYGSVIVVLNSDEWLLRKKGYVFMPYTERAHILFALECVWHVAPAFDDDDTICSSLYALEPHYFCNGGDRNIANSKEHETCERLDIEEVFNVGEDKIQSSSKLVEQVK